MTEQDGDGLDLRKWLLQGLCHAKDFPLKEATNPLKISPTSQLPASPLKQEFL